MLNKLDELVLVLKNDGITQEEIQKTVEFVAQLVAGKYYAELIANFTSEEIEKINEAPTQEEASNLIRAQFFQKNGVTADVLRDKMFDFYAGQILEDYLKNKKLPTKSN